MNLSQSDLNLVLMSFYRGISWFGHHWLHSHPVSETIQGMEQFFVNGIVVPTWFVSRHGNGWIGVAASPNTCANLNLPGALGRAFRKQSGTSRPLLQSVCS